MGSYFQPKILVYLQKELPVPHSYQIEIGCNGLSAAD